MRWKDFRLSLIVRSLKLVEGVQIVLFVDQFCEVELLIEEVRKSVVVLVVISSS